MQLDFQSLAEQITGLSTVVTTPFWKEFDFWIPVIVGIVGSFFSVLAFLQARKAKDAAIEAGNTVKMQTIIIELSEVSHRLDSLDMKVQFSEVRDLVNQTSRRLERLMAGFHDHAEFGETVSALEEALKIAQASLVDVCPINPNIEDTSYAVYHAIQVPLANLNGLVGKFMGLLEKKTAHIGE